MKIQISILALTLAAAISSQASIIRSPAAAPAEFDSLIKESKKSELELKAKLDNQMGRGQENKVVAKQHRPSQMNADQVVAQTENFFTKKSKRTFTRNRNADLNRVSQEFQTLGN
jgi:hypothetical protein